MQKELEKKTKTNQTRTGIAERRNQAKGKVIFKDNLKPRDKSPNRRDQNGCYQAETETKEVKRRPEKNDHILVDLLTGRGTRADYACNDTQRQREKL